MLFCANILRGPKSGYSPAAAPAGFIR